MTETKGPHQWAFKITHILNAALGAEHFPIDVKAVARDISKTLYPDDPISAIMSASLPGFEGALVPAPEGKLGWGIIYNKDVVSVGRINFTLAHEFGHYLLHRINGPPEFHCTKSDTFRWDDGYAQREREANQFAANLLMPLDDFRRQLADDVRPTVDAISECAGRYKVSFMAACLRWISYTKIPAVFVVSRDGFIVWARSSGPAMRLGAFFRTANRVVELPDGSLARGNLTDKEREGVELPGSVWFKRECHEIAFSADAYDYFFSIVFVGDPDPDEET